MRRSRCDQQFLAQVAPLRVGRRRRRFVELRDWLEVLLDMTAMLHRQRAVRNRRRVLDLPEAEASECFLERRWSPGTEAELQARADFHSRGVARRGGCAVVESAAAASPDLRQVAQEAELTSDARRIVARVDVGRMRRGWRHDGFCGLPVRGEHGAPEAPEAVDGALAALHRAHARAIRRLQQGPQFRKRSVQMLIHGIARRSLRGGRKPREAVGEQLLEHEQERLELAGLGSALVGRIRWHAVLVDPVDAGKLDAAADRRS